MKKKQAELIFAEPAQGSQRAKSKQTNKQVKRNRAARFLAGNLPKFYVLETSSNNYNSSMNNNVNTKAKRQHIYFGQ